jgi:hypothetical protein
MAKEKRNRQQGAFRVPNSIVQGLTTTTDAGLNRLSVFKIVTMFGLIAHVDQDHPEKEVRIRTRDILEIIQVGRSAAHAVDRHWTTEDGQETRKTYQATRFKPRQRRQVNDALFAIFNSMVVIRHYGKDRAVEHRLVHILDSFGYRYKRDGQELDVHDLPTDCERVNVGADKRPVWKIKRRTSTSSQFERPSAILFRINQELAHEIKKRKGTISSTIFARRVFELFRLFTQQPAAIRLLILVLRQTNSHFSRILSKLLDDLNWDTTHPTRAITQLTEALEQLQRLEVVTSFRIEADVDLVVIEANREWSDRLGEA